jgi:hypothetical protein
MGFPTAWLVPAATAVWAVATWAHEHALQRDKERSRITALYVNPFLSACEDLQARIYKLLELDGLHLLQQRYPDGTHADETLYLIVRFFGWLAIVNRHGPYTQDSVVIRHATAIRRAFGTSRPGYAVGPFNFFPAEQKALGKMVMHEAEGEHGRELDTISFYEFREIVNSEYRMPHSPAVQQTLENLRNAQGVDDIQGKERLAETQNHLVDLLEYLEEKEGYSLFPGERQKCRCENLVELSPGRILHSV